MHLLELMEGDAAEDDKGEYYEEDEDGYDEGGYDEDEDEDDGGEEDEDEVRG